MCGIAGIFAFGGGEVDPSAPGRMLEPIRHRGPDGTGVHVDRQIGLAHARLGIIDLAGGGQPMPSPDGSLWIVFNGEIFNYLELRSELAARGHRFATRSDTEVILHLYEEKGEACVHDLNGQWAFAIWDRRAKRLVLSRDRLGVEPLFYAVGDATLRFGSEVKALFALPGSTRAIDPIGLAQLFTFWTTLPPRTVFEGIAELPPGHCLIAEDGAVRVRRYWGLDYPGSPVPSRSADDYAEELLARLLDATRLRLRSDVPVGTYLSGGLDSSLVTALAGRLTAAPLRTFSITFDGPDFDESPYQQTVVDFLRTEHEAVRCTGRAIGEVFPEVVWHTEKPLLRTAPAPLFLLSKRVRECGIKVVLTGEGSDEMLGGYDIFKEAKVRRFAAARPDSRWRVLLFKRLYPYLPGLRSQPAAYLAAFFQATPEQLASPFFSHLPRWTLTAGITRLFSRELRSRLAAYDGYADLEGQLPARYRDWDWLSRAQYLEAAYLLPGYILSSQGDRVAMAHAVEGRFPFLDHRVVEFAAALPPRLRLRGLDEKHLLKRSAAGLVPAAIRRRPKQPYRAPDAESFAGPGGGRLDYVEELLAPDRLARDGLFEPAPVRTLVEKVRSGKAAGARDNMALVGVLSTQLVVDQFVNRFGRRTSGAGH